MTEQTSIVETRIERDSMGEMHVPVTALYGATTARAIENFPINGPRFSRSFLRALGLIKAAARRSTSNSVCSTPPNTN